LVEGECVGRSEVVEGLGDLVGGRVDASDPWRAGRILAAVDERRTMRKLAVLATVFGAVTLFGTGLAGAANTFTVISFDELSPRPANGVHFLGATYNFAQYGSPSNAATYDFVGPGTTAYISGPGLEGPTDSSKLMVTWDQTTPGVQFGIAFNCNCNPYFLVQYKYGDGSSSPVQTVQVSPHGFGFAETQIRYFGGSNGNLKQMILTFPSAAASRFIIDNLTYNQGGA
jgi:hypothetical protein